MFDAPFTGEVELLESVVMLEAGDDVDEGVAGEEVVLHGQDSQNSVIGEGFHKVFSRLEG